jgi:hypothetical protein
MVEHPLDLADPDRDSGEFGGIRVDLDAQDRLRPDARKLLGDAQDERAPLNGLELEVLERSEGDVQEVARAAGGIEDADRPEAIEECPRRAAAPRGSGPFLGLASRRRVSCVTCACIAAYSRRRGRMTTGSTSRQMSSRLV